MATSKVLSLDATMEAANKLLKVVVRDQSSLSYAVKTSHENDHDTFTVASLHWFVYPKEVVYFLQQGLTEVPETMDRQALVGPVRPVAWLPKEQMAVNASVLKRSCRDGGESIKSQGSID